MTQNGSGPAFDPAIGSEAREVDPLGSKIAFENNAPADANQDLQFHPLANIFPLLEGAEFDALVADIKANGLREEIMLYEGMILDGRNRYRACLAAGVPPCSIPGDNWIADPAAYVISANVHRRHLTAAQKRGLIAKVIKAQPEKSDRQIAATAKVSPTTVGTVRAKMEKTGDVSKLDTRRDTKGRKQPAKRKPDSAAKPEVDDDTATDRRARRRQKRRKAKAEAIRASGAAAKSLVADLIATNRDLAQRVYVVLTTAGAAELIMAFDEQLGATTAESEDADLMATAEAEPEPHREKKKKRGKKKQVVVEKKLADTIGAAFSELAELGDECREVVDNAPEGLSESQRIQKLGEAADTLEQLRQPDVPAELADIKISYTPSRQRYQSRASRRDDACAILSICITALDEINENDARHGDACGLRDELENTIEEAECAEFPGMYE